MTRSLFIREVYQTDSVLKPGAVDGQKPGLKYAARVCVVKMTIQEGSTRDGFYSCWSYLITKLRGKNHKILIEKRVTKNEITGLFTSLLFSLWILINDPHSAPDVPAVGNLDFWSAWWLSKCSLVPRQWRI